MIEDKRPVRTLGQQEKNDTSKVPDMYLDKGTTLIFGSESNANFVDVISVGPIGGVEEVFVNETNIDTGEFPNSEFHTHDGEGVDVPFQGDFKYTERTYSLGKQAEVVEGDNNHISTTTFNRSVSGLGVRGIRVNFTTGSFTHRDLENRRKDAFASFELRLLDEDGNVVKTARSDNTKYFCNNPTAIQVTLESRPEDYNRAWEYQVVMRIRTNMFSTAVSGTWSASTVTEFFKDTQTYDSIAYCSGKLVANDVGSGAPKREYIVEGYKVDVPVINNGMFLGQFEKAVSNNHAWNSMAVIVDKKWGAGLPLDKINIMSFYDFAQYCSEILPDGRARYEHSQVLIKSDNYFRIASQIVGAADGKLYEDTSGRIGVLVDKQTDKRRVITSYDIVDEQVKRTTVPEKKKINYVQAEFDDKYNNYSKTIVSTQDDDAVVRNGLIKKELKLDMCTDPVEADRTIKKVLVTSQITTTSYVFKVGHAHEDLQVGEVVALFDRVHARANYCGKTAVGSTQTLINIDKRTPIDLSDIDGDKEIVIDNDRGVPTVRKIIAWTDSSITLESPLESAPVSFTSFGVRAANQTTGLQPTLVRVLGLSESKGVITVEGIEYNDSLYSHVEQGTALVVPKTRLIPEVSQQVENLRLVKNPTELKATWDTMPDTTYNYYWKKFPDPTNLAVSENLGGGETTGGEATLPFPLDPAMYVIYTYIFDKTTGEMSAVKTASINLTVVPNGNSSLTPPTDLKVMDKFAGVATNTYNESFFGVTWEQAANVDPNGPKVSGYLVIISQDGKSIQYKLPKETNYKVVTSDTLADVFGADYGRTFNVAVYTYDDRLDTTNPTSITISNPAPPTPEIGIRVTGDVVLTDNGSAVQDLDVVGSVVYVWKGTDDGNGRPDNALRIYSQDKEYISIPEDFLVYDNSTYTFEAAWVDGFGESSVNYGRNSLAFGPDVLVPLPPELITATASGISEIKVNFTHDGTWLDRLDVYIRATNGNGTWVHVDTPYVIGTDPTITYDEDTGEGFFLLQGLDYNTEYEIYATASNRSSLPSEHSNTVIGHVVPYADVEDIRNGLADARKDILDNRVDIDKLELETDLIETEIEEITIDVTKVQNQADEISKNLAKLGDDLRPALDLEIRTREETDKELFKTTASLASFRRAQNEYNNTVTDAIFYVDPESGEIGLKAYQYTDQKFSQANILIDGVNSRIDLNVERLDDLNDQVIDARSDIVLLAGQVELKASYTEMKEYVSGALDAILPAYSFGFFNSDEGWQAVNGTLTHAGTGKIAVEWGDIENTGLSYSADDNPIITIDFKRTSGTGYVGDLIVSFSNGSTKTYHGVVDEIDGVKTLNLSSEQSYSGVVSGLRFVLGETTNDKFDITSIVIGKPSAQLEQLDGLSARVTQAEVDINAIEGQITTFVTTTYYDENTVTLNNVSQVLDSEDVIISLKATQQELDDQGTVAKANDASVWIDGANATIRNQVISFNAEDGGIDDQIAGLQGGLNSVQQELSTIDGAAIKSNLVSINRLEIESKDLAELQFYQQLQLAKQRDGLLEVGENVATVSQTLKSVSDDVSANAQAITSLQASSGTVSGQIDALFDSISSVESSLDGVARATFSNKAEVSKVNSELQATSELLQSVELDVKGNTTAINSLSASLTDAEGKITANAELIQSVELKANNNTSAINGLVTSLQDLGSDVTANAELLQQVQQDVEGNATAIQEMGVDITNVQNGVNANAQLIQEVKQTADGTASSLTQLVNRVSDAEREITANTALIQDVSTDVSGLTQTVSSLTTRITDAEREITANTGLIQTLRQDVDGNTEATNQLSARVTSNTQGISANASLIQDVDLRVDGVVTSMNQLSTQLAKVTQDIEGNTQSIEANASLIQQVKQTADGNVTAIQQLDTRVTNTESFTAAQVILNSEFEEEIGQLTSSISNQVSSINNISLEQDKDSKEIFYAQVENLRQQKADLEMGDSIALAETQLVALTNKTGAMAQEILTLTAATETIDGQVTATLDRVSAVETNLNGVASSLFSLSAAVKNTQGDLAQAEISLGSTIDELGEVSARAYLGVSDTVDGKTEITGVTFDSKTNGIRFKGDTFELENTAGDKALSYIDDEGKWVFNGSLIVGGYHINGVDDIRAQDGKDGKDGKDGDTIFEVYRYSVNGVDDWHDEMRTGDLYRQTAVMTNGVRGPWSSSARIAGEDGAQGPRGLQGVQGEKGDQGIAGEKGEDGKTSYFHVAYADTSTGGGFSQNPSGKLYIGTYVDFTPTDSTDPSKYTWQLTKGAQGEKGDQGIAGTNGEDGRTTYLHIAYADTATGDGFSQLSTGKAYIGTYTDFVLSDSSDPSRYSWALIKGENGVGTFTLDSNNANVTITGNAIKKVAGGSGWNAGAFSLERYEAITVSGKVTSGNAMIGISKATSENHSFTSIDFAIYNSAGVLRVYESGSNVFVGDATDRSDLYTISCDGKSVKYYQNGNLVYTSSKTPSGTYAFDSSFHSMGAAMDFITVVPSGISGSDGTNGTNGERGAGRYEVGTSNGVWYDSTAWGAVPNSRPVVDDIVTIYKTTDPSVSTTKKFNGTGWDAYALVVNGNALINGSVDGDKFNAASKITAGAGNSSASLDGEHATYRIYAGNTNPANANFRVDKNGIMEAKGGKFSGTIDVKSGTSGARTEITEKLIKVYNSSGNLVVRIGVW